VAAVDGRIEIGAATPSGVFLLRGNCCCRLGSSQELRAPAAAGLLPLRILST
jgi:hypothetical protein